MLITLPFVLFILNFYPLMRPRSEIKLPFLFLSLLFSLINIYSQNAAHALYSSEHMPLDVKFCFSVRAYIFYITKTLFPFNLAPLYIVREEIIEILSFRYLGSLAMFLAITIGCFIFQRKTRLFSALWLFYILTLLPVNSIFQIGNHFAADRYTYLPGIAPVFLLGLAGAQLYVTGFNTGAKRILAKRAILLVPFVFIVILNASLLPRQIDVWKNSINLWNREIELYPDIIALPYKNRGVAYLDAGKYDKAARDFTKALGMRDHDPALYLNRAIAYIKSGSRDRALEDIKSAATLGSKDAVRYLKENNISW